MVYIVLNYGNSPGGPLHHVVHLHSETALCRFSSFFFVYGTIFWFTLLCIGNMGEYYMIVSPLACLMPLFSLRTNLEDNFIQLNGQKVNIGPNWRKFPKWRSNINHNLKLFLIHNLEIVFNNFNHSQVYCYQVIVPRYQHPLNHVV